HGEPRPHLEQRGGGRSRIAETGRHLDLIAVADDDRRVTQRLARVVPRLLLGPPEHRPVVEVVDGHITSAANLERRQSGGTARLVREPGAGGPKERRRGDGGQGELIAREAHVWRLGLAIEEERKAVRRKDLAEDDRRAQLWFGSDPVAV